MDQVDDVAAEIGENAAAVIPEIPPVEREPVGIERASGGGAEPEVIIAARRAESHRRASQAAAVGGHPDPRLADLAQHARADDLDDPVVVFAGVDQVPHLGDAFIFFGRPHHGPAFLDAVCQRLLAVDVLAGLAGENGRNPMPVIGSRDDHGVDVLAVEHAAKIASTSAGSATGRRPGAVEVGIVDVANRRDLDLRETFERVDQAGSHAADADEAQHDLLARRHGGLFWSVSVLGSCRARRVVHPGRRSLGGSACATARAAGGQKLATSPVVHDVSGRSNPITIARGRKTGRARRLTST